MAVNQRALGSTMNHLASGKRINNAADAAAGMREGHVHDVQITKEAPNYRSD